jgi:hypothetical protein
MSSNAYGPSGKGGEALRDNGSLLALNLLAGGPAWAVWPLIGWGIGLAAHGIAVFLGTPLGPADGRVTGS